MRDRLTQEVRLRPEFPITAIASSIHGILNEDAAGFGDSGDVLAEFYADTVKLFESPDTYTAGWNVQFDVDMINDALCRHELPRIQFRNVLDLLRAAKRIFPIQVIGGYSLDAAFCALFPTRAGLNRLLAARATHSAERDVELTYEVFEAMFERLRDAHGSMSAGVQINTLEDFVRYINTPFLITEWPIGKHKGKPIREVIQQDRSYVQWVMRQPWFDEPKHLDFKFTLESMIRNGASGRF